jgi:uncharacterized membrane protein
MSKVFDKPLHERHKPVNTFEATKQKLGVQDRIALVITAAVGTMYAVYFFAIFMAGWMLWQAASGQKAFDPYPFAFLLFLGNIVQLLLMPLIMVGQNIQGQHVEIRANEEYKTTMSSYCDIEHILEHLDAQDKELLKQTQLIEDLLKRIGDKQ